MPRSAPPAAARRLLWQLFAALAVCMAMFVSMTGNAAAATAASEQADQALESLVFIDALWYVELPADSIPKLPDGSPAPPLRFEGGCTGWFPDTDGDAKTHTNPLKLLVTAGHCADDAMATETLQSILDYYKQLVAQAKPENKPETALPDKLPKPKRVFKGVQAASVKHKAFNGVISLRVKKNWPLKQGDETIMTLSGPTKADIPAIPIATERPDLLAPVAAIGFAGQFLDIPETYNDPRLPLKHMLVDVLDQSTLSPSVKDGTVSGYHRPPDNKYEFTEVSAAATYGMSGGPVISLGGHPSSGAIGVVSQGTDLQPFNLATNTGLLRSSLESSGATLTDDDTGSDAPPAAA